MRNGGLQMKLFRDKQTGEMYLCICERENSINMLSLYDSSFLTAVDKAMDNYEEVNTSPKMPEPVEMTYEFRLRADK